MSLCLNMARHVADRCMDGKLQFVLPATVLTEILQTDSASRATLRILVARILLIIPPFPSSDFQFVCVSSQKQYHDSQAATLCDRVAEAPA